MPELPEVETIRRDLEKKIIGKKIKAVKIYDAKLRQTVQPRLLVGKSFKRLGRRGKLLLIELSSSKFLLIHLKMTGQLIYRYDHKIIYGGHDVPKTADNLPNQFTRAAFYFDDSSVLYFNDLRRFGYLKIVEKKVKDHILSERFGPDAFSPPLSFKTFLVIMEKNKKRRLKATLLDQKVMAGLGNIYVDEIAFKSKLQPQRLMASLSSLEIKSLYRQIKQVLAHALRHRGTTFGTKLAGHYVDSQGQRGNYLDFLKVYQQEGRKCQRCRRGVIKKVTVAGRGTRYCPHCQK